MITKTEAVAASILKWERIVVGLQEGQPVYTRGNCGFCEFIRAAFSGELNCHECPLYPGICSNYSRDSLFWQITGRLDRKRLALLLAKRMVKEIRKRGDEWIKESK